MADLKVLDCFGFTLRRAKHEGLYTIFIIGHYRGPTAKKQLQFFLRPGSALDPEEKP
jgi:hypothetical protein